MDSISELECGLLTPPEVTPVSGVVARSALVAQEWAKELGLRQGNTWGPTSKALVPVVGAWAAERGLSGPAYRELGRGLKWAGLWRRTTGEHGRRHLVLHREDAALLWRLVRAAWAPELAPGDPRRQKKKPRKPAEPRSRLRRNPLPLFHEELARLGRAARPLVDSLGRVWPGGTAAARVLGGNHKALDNARRHLEVLLSGVQPIEASGLNNAVARHSSWRGVWWRHLTAQELAAVPAGHRTGMPLPGLGWGLTCPRCSGCAPVSW